MENFHTKRTDLFRVYANSPGIHGRGMFTAESADTAKEHLLAMSGVPIDSWHAQQRSEENREIVDIWISNHQAPDEAKDTYFTAERVWVVEKRNEEGTEDRSHRVP
jgi:hypothetical protein